MLPEKAVLNSKERLELSKFESNEIEIIANVAIDFPVLAFQIFGIHYDKDIVLVTKHPKWNMHEFAQVQLPDGPIWLMKDSEEGSLDQFITVDAPEIMDLLPEIPLNIRAAPVKVRDNSTADWLDLQFNYQNSIAEQVSVQYKAKNTFQNLGKRNGSTMGHSKNQVMAILDLPLRRFAKSAQILYDGKDYGIQKILGLKKFQMHLQQTQGGISSGEFKMFQEENGKIFSLHKNDVTQEWILAEDGDGLVLFQKNELRTLSYFFDGNKRLKSANVQLWNQEEACFNMDFFPPLPNFNLVFRGEHESKFVMDINGQKAHCHGKIMAFWEDEKLIYEITPEAPWWAAERPMRSVVSKDKNGIIDVTCNMVKDQVADKARVE